MEALDFFCGVGGLTRGLIDSGICVKAGFDNDLTCKDTYESNNKTKFVCEDIADVDLKYIIRCTGLKKFNNVLFAGCAPCQPFSSQQKGTERHHAASLLSEFGRLIAEAKPGYVLIENVPGMAKVKGNSTFKRFLKLLESNKYDYQYQVLDAKGYGVPQSRKRLVLIASRKCKVSMPTVAYGKGLRKIKTVRDAIEHFPPLEAGEFSAKIPNHLASNITDLNLQRLRHTPSDGGSRADWTKRLHLLCHSKGYTGHSDVYGRLAWDGPAPTLTARCTSISNGRYGHPEQDRAISLREAAALQSFPDGYEFYGMKGDITRQIGNAVPVEFAVALGKHISLMAGE